MNNTNSYIMRDAIMNNLNDAGQLEKMYRDDKAAFKREFNLTYPGIRENQTAQAWHERLNYEGDEISWGKGVDLIFVIAASLLAGLIAKIPEVISIEEEYFYPRNISFIVLPFLTAYFAWKQRLEPRGLLIISAAFIASAIYINALPGDMGSDTLVLACIHLPLFLWAALGAAFAGGKLNDRSRRLEFLRYNGDLVVMTTLILIAGGLFSAITIGLFSLIDIHIEEYYFQYIAVLGASAAPIVGTYLVRTNPQLVSKVSPVIARVFTPLVLITLVIYLIAVIYTGKDPYNDREFLLIFNVMLIGVMAIILFSIAGTPKDQAGKSGALMLFSLSIATIIVNAIALSAILFRISQWGITPNRLAVLGGDILILANLVIVAYRLFTTIRDVSALERVERSIASFLPLYILWAILVAFAFPILFNFQ